MCLQKQSEEPAGHQRPPLPGILGLTHTGTERVPQPKIAHARMSKAEARKTAVSAWGLRVAGRFTRLSHGLLSLDLSSSAGGPPASEPLMGRSNFTSLDHFFRETEAWAGHSWHRAEPGPEARSGLLDTCSSRTRLGACYTRVGR